MAVTVGYSYVRSVYDNVKNALCRFTPLAYDPASLQFFRGKKFYRGLQFFGSDRQLRRKFLLLT